MKHTELGLPMYYAIATMQGKAPLWREAIKEFNRIHDERWEGGKCEYYGYDGTVGRNGTFCRVINDTRKVTVLTPEEFLNIVNKKTNMQKLTITVDHLLKIHEIACVAWKTKIAKYMARMDASKNVTFTQGEVDEMFGAATKEQLPILKEIFGEKKAVIDWDMIKTGSKVMIKHTGNQLARTPYQHINTAKPVNVVFFKTPHYINSDIEFVRKGTSYDSYCTFHQDGKFVTFTADDTIEYITEVIEY